MKLCDQIVVVTGTNGAVGSELVGYLKEQARHVVAVVRGSSVVWRNLGAGHSEVSGDLADPQVVGKIVAALKSSLETCHALVNVVGGFSLDGPVESLQAEDWEHMWALNFKTSLYTCQALIPIFKAQGFGRIINFGSQAGDRGMAGAAPYAVSKSAVHALTRTLAVEGGGVVTANLIIPSIIDTPANREAMPEADFSRWTTPMAIVERVARILDEVEQPPNGESFPV